MFHRTTVSIAATLTALSVALFLLTGCEGTSADERPEAAAEDSVWTDLKEAIVGERHTVPAGTVIAVRLGQSLSSKENRSGDEFVATLGHDLEAEGEVLAPAGSEVTGRVVGAEDGGRVKGRAHLVLTLETLRVGEEVYDLEVHPLTWKAKGTKKKDALKIGGASGIGAALGAILDGGDGAAKGAGAGAAAGTAFVLLTKGDQVELGVEQTLRFTLEDDLELPVARPSRP